LAFAAQGVSVNTARFLLDKGADASSKDNKGRTPMFWAVESDCHKDNRVSTNEESLVEMVALLIKAGADVNADKSLNAITPLHNTVWGDQKKLAELLLDEGAHVNAVCSKQMTPLHYAAIEDSIKVAKLILERGADINARSFDRRTPLHYTTIYNSVQVAKLLLEQDTLTEVRDYRGGTAIDRALVERAVEVATLIGKHKPKTIPEQFSTNNGADERPLGVQEEDHPSAFRSLGPSQRASGRLPHLDSPLRYLTMKHAMRGKRLQNLICTTRQSYCRVKESISML
jgi:ankyrin repeat protein